MAEGIGLYADCGTTTQTQLIPFAKRNDIAALLVVDAVVLLEGWSHSNGCRAEIVIAQWLGKPVAEIADLVALDFHVELIDASFSPTRRGDDQC